MLNGRRRGLICNVVCHFTESPMRKKYFAIVAVTVCLLSLAGACGGFSSYRKCEGAVWATSYNITYRSDRNLDDSIISVMRIVENSLSPFADSSLVSRINRGETDVTDSLFRRIFAASQQVNKLSRGLFDPTVAPLVNLWGFGYKHADVEPSQAQIDSALAMVGIAGCRIVDGNLVKAHDKMEFDFSAITKGYGCDLIGEMLQRNGCSDFLVEIGGEVKASGINPQGQAWRIMVDAPLENDTAVVHRRLAVVEVSDCGVATSGNYRNFRAVAGGKVWHTISPVTGRPAQSPTLSATVIARDAMMADAFATACMAMPTSDALAMIDSINGVEAMLVTADSTGFRLHTSREFPLLK